VRAAEPIVKQQCVQLRGRGVLTLPVGLRRKYGLRAGDVFWVADLGAGAFALLPKAARVADLGDKVADLLQADGVTVEDLMECLDQERERCYREHWVDD